MTSSFLSNNWKPFLKARDWHGRTELQGVKASWGGGEYVKWLINVKSNRHEMKGELRVSGSKNKKKF